MREGKLKPDWEKRFVNTFVNKHDLSVAENQLNRSFNPAESDLAWAMDVPYIRTRTGCLYLIKQLAIPLDWQKISTKWLVVPSVRELCILGIT